MIQLNFRIYFMKIYSYLLACIVFFPGCFNRKQPQIKHIQGLMAPLVLKPFKLKIDGVECALCAAEVERLFASDIDYYGVEYVHFMHKYEQGYLEMRLARGKKNLDNLAVQALLLRHGFKFFSYEGQFVGSFFEEECRRYFKFYDSDQKLLLSDTPSSYEPISDLYWADIFLQGTVRVDGMAFHDERGWWLYIQKGFS